MRGIVKACRRPQIRPLPVRPRDRNGGFPESCGRGLSGPGAGGVPHGSLGPASPRHALLAENLGKPSLWVIISAPWYYLRRASGLAAGRGRHLPSGLALGHTAHR